VHYLPADGAQNTRNIVMKSRKDTQNKRREKNDKCRRQDVSAHVLATLGYLENRLTNAKRLLREPT
jgi:hypothetical protein